MVVVVVVGAVASVEVEMVALVGETGGLSHEATVSGCW